MKSDTQIARASAALQGRELDARVAELVMGWRVGLDDCPAGRKYITHVWQSFSGPEYNWSKRGEWYQIIETDPAALWPRATLLPNFSTAIGAAFQVVEKMRERGYKFRVSICHDLWVARFWGDDMDAALKEAPTAPEAIALAALAALEQGQAPEESGDMGRRSA